MHRMQNYYYQQQQHHYNIIVSCSVSASYCIKHLFIFQFNTILTVQIRVIIVFISQTLQKFEDIEFRNIAQKLSYFQQITDFVTWFFFFLPLKILLFILSSFFFISPYFPKYSNSICSKSVKNSEHRKSKGTSVILQLKI